MRYHGRCWTFGDNIPTDRFVKPQYVFESLDVMAQHVLEDLNPDFPKSVQPGDIVIAGLHFGQSSGRAIAVKALQATGIGCVVAASFARTFYRNCFEIGLPALAIEGINTQVRDGDELVVDIAAGHAANVTSGERWTASGTDPFLLDMLHAGGLIKLAASRPDLFG